MKKRFLLLVFLPILTGTIYAQETNKIFVLRPSMISSFDSLNFEISLTDLAQKEIERTDFSKYSFVWHVNSLYLFPIIDDKMSIRLPEIFIYKKGKSIMTKEGKILLNAHHLNKDDPRVLSVKRIIK